MKSSSSPPAAKELENVPQKDMKRITAKILALATTPRPPGCEKLAAQEKYRMRQENHRIVHAIDNLEFVVTVVKIGHRRDVYR